VVPKYIGFSSRGKISNYTEIEFFICSISYILICIALSRMNITFFIMTELSILIHYTLRKLMLKLNYLFLFNNLYTISSK